MNTPESSDGYPANGQEVRALGASAWRRALYRLEGMESDEDAARYYADKIESCQAALAVGPSLSESRYIELLETAVMEAQKEYLDMAEFHAWRLQRERTGVNDLLAASFDRS